MRHWWIRLGNSVGYLFISFAFHSNAAHRCHMGKTIVYDTVSNLSWSVDVRTHPILTVIEKVLSEPWAPSVEIGREVPEAIAEEDCVVSNLLFEGVYSFN
jgi:putative lipase involved disintegration of autophagic bodies